MMQIVETSYQERPGDPYQNHAEVLARNPFLARFQSNPSALQPYVGNTNSLNLTHVMMSKPTLIFAAGAWYPQTVFDPIIEKLSDYRSHSVAFPSVQQATSIVDLQPDIDAVRCLVQQETEAGNEVVIIAHSWAGLPVSSALEGLSKSERETAGQKGGVMKLIFITAFIPNIGESLIGAFGGMPPPWYVRDVSSKLYI